MLTTLFFLDIKIMNNGLLNRIDRQSEYENAFENLWQSFRSMYKVLIDKYTSTSDKEEKAKQLYVLKQLSKIDTCRKLNNVFIGKGIVKDWDFAPQPYKSRLTDQEDIEAVKKLSKPVINTNIQSDLNDFKATVERFISQATVKDNSERISRMLEDKEDR